MDHNNELSKAIQNFTQSLLDHIKKTNEDLIRSIVKQEMTAALNSISNSLKRNKEPYVVQLSINFEDEFNVSIDDDSEEDLTEEEKKQADELVAQYRQQERKEQDSLTNREKAAHNKRIASYVAEILKSADGPVRLHRIVKELREKYKEELGKYPNHKMIQLMHHDNRITKVGYGLYTFKERGDS